MLKAFRAIPSSIRKKGANSQHMNRWFANMHDRENQSIENLITPEIDAISER